MGEKDKEQQVKREIAEHPNREDVHEQRDANQPREGVVPPKPRAPTQTESDRERADWEGMGQPQSHR